MSANPSERPVYRCISCGAFYHSTECCPDGCNCPDDSDDRADESPRRVRG